MPLRDHFHPPVSRMQSWEAVHSGWPMVIVQSLYARLPKGYVAAPGVHVGAGFEVDVSAYNQDDTAATESLHEGNGGVAVATWAPPAPTLTIESDIPEQDEFEVRIYDDNRGRTLVAAIEIVSPHNKDRPDSRGAFVAKVSALVQKGVCVSIVDLVTDRHSNLYDEFLEQIGGADPLLGESPPSLYAVTIRSRKRTRKRPFLDSWFYPLEIGMPLPTLPLWLAADMGVSLELESTYEETCRVLHIR